MKLRFAAALLVAAVWLTLPCAARSPEEPVTETVLEQEEQQLADGLLWERLLFFGTDGLVHEVQFLTVDMGTNTLLLATPQDAAANDGGGGLGEALTDMAEAARSNGKDVLAAINGDFYKTLSDGGSGYTLYASLGVMVKDGLWLSDGQRSQGAMYFGVTKDGAAVMGSAEPSGDWDAVKEELFTAIGGELWLIREGALNWENIRWRTDSETLRQRYGHSGSALTETGEVRNDLSVYPRSCIGIRADGSVVLMCAAMGYQSAGLDMVQAARLMLDKGCVEAMNLDGGPSSQMAIARDDTMQLLSSVGVSPRIGEGLLVVSGRPAEQPGAEIKDGGAFPLWLLIPAGLAVGSIFFFLLRQRSRKRRGRHLS